VRQLDEMGPIVRAALAGSGTTDSETNSRFVEWMLSVVATWH